MTYRVFSYLVISVVTAFLTSCGETTTNPKDEFSTNELLENTSQNLIIANYSDLETELKQLQVYAAYFTQDPTVESLTNTQESFKRAYKLWQHCSAFEFGPAEQVALRALVNTFPTDTSSIQNFISGGTWNFDMVSALASIGFPALDYVLFGEEKSKEFIVNSYANNANKKQYLLDLVENLLLNITQVKTTWIDSYKAEFISDLSKTASSPLSAIVNQLNFDYELIKWAKVGIPLGKKTLGETLPHQVEGYYSGITNDLLLENFTSIENIIFGQSRLGENGVGLDDYLNHLETYYSDNVLLTQQIEYQFNSILQKHAALTSTLSEEIKNNPQTVEALYEEIQKMIVLTKTDLASALSILITYQDNDGD